MHFDLAVLIEGPGYPSYANHSISDKWDFNFYGTIGQGGSNLPWTVTGVFARRYSNNNQLGLGFRFWGVDYSKDEGLLDQRASIQSSFYGFVISYEFN